MHALILGLPPHSLLVWGLTVFGCACPHLGTAAFSAGLGALCLWLCMSPLGDCRLLCWSGGSLSLAVHVPTWGLPPSLLVWGLSLSLAAHVSLGDCRLLRWSGGSLSLLSLGLMDGPCYALHGKWFLWQYI